MTCQMTHSKAEEESGLGLPLVCLTPKPVILEGDMETMRKTLAKMSADVGKDRCGGRINFQICVLFIFAFFQLTHLLLVVKLVITLSL